MNSYKLVQFLKTYVNLERVEVLIKICSYISWSWLNKLGYKYQNIYKDVFIDRYEWPDMVEDHINFLKIMEDLKPYMIEFEEDRTMKPKVYPNNYIIEDLNKHSFIIITYNM